MNKAILELLDQACARNAAVELHYQSGKASAGQAAAPMLTAQSRMLMMDAKHLYLDAPQSIGQRVHLKAGDSVNAYFSIRGEMNGFRATVVSFGRPVKINRQQSVPGVCLTIPKEINDGQRRGDYRVMLVRDEPITVHLCEAGEDQHDRCPIDAVRFDGQIINLSRGGFSLRVEAADKRKLRERARYYAAFQLSDGGGDFCFLVDTRHIRPILDGEALRAGMQFLAWPEATELRRRINKIGAFLVEMERKQCRSSATNELATVARK